MVFFLVAVHDRKTLLPLFLHLIQIDKIFFSFYNGEKTNNSAAVRLLFFASFAKTVEKYASYLTLSKSADSLHHEEGTGT